MAAGLGFKTFTTGEVLTAADTNGYLMQGILVFATEAARNSAITSPQEGQFAFTKDTNSTWYYDGAAWVASGASGDVTGVTAGTGISVTNPTGPVPTVAIDTAVTVDKTTAQTLTNKTLTSPALTTPTISTLTTNGDLLYGTGSGALSRIGIGSTSQVLTVTAGIPSWETPAGGGGMTLLGSGTLSGGTVTLSSIPGTYKNLTIILDSITQSSTDFVNIRLNNSTTNVSVITTFSGTLTDGAYAGTIFVGSANSSYKMNSTGINAFQFTIYNYAAATQKAINGNGAYKYSTDTNYIPFITWGGTNDATAYNRIDFVTAGGTFSSGNYKIYGVN